MKKHASVDAYLADVPADQRAALKKLRAAIKAAAANCTFYLMSYAAMRSQAPALKGRRLGKGSIQFSADRPLPATLVRKLVKARIAEVGAGG